MSMRYDSSNLLRFNSFSSSRMDKLVDKFNGANDKLSVGEARRAAEILSKNGYRNEAKAFLDVAILLKRDADRENRRLDTDGDGRLSKTEVQAIYARSGSDKVFSFNDLIKKVAKPLKNGFLTVKEYSQFAGWRDENDRNKYGDPKDTVYAGGNPLFDAATGRTITLYEYAVKKNPTKPWLKVEGY